MLPSSLKPCRLCIILTIKSKLSFMVWLGLLVAFLISMFPCFLTNRICLITFPSLPSKQVWLCVSGQRYEWKCCLGALGRNFQGSQIKTPLWPALQTSFLSPGAHVIAGSPQAFLDHEGTCQTEATCWMAE